VWTPIAGWLLGAVRRTKRGRVNYLGFVLANIARDKTRLLFLAVSIISAFMLFGALSAVGTFFRGGYKYADNVRIFIYPKYTNTLPMRYLEQIRSLPGLRKGLIDIAVNRGGYYQDPRNWLSPFAINASSSIWIARSNTSGSKSSMIHVMSRFRSRRSPSRARRRARPALRDKLAIRSS